MIKRPGILVIVFILIYCQVYSSPKIKSVAITDFVSNGFNENQSWVGGSCADVIIDQISSDRSIRIVERAQLNRIIEELKLQMGGLVNTDAVVETGNLLGVTFFITGSISLFEDQVVLSDRIVSVETGEILSTNNIKGQLKDLFKLQEQLAKKISADLIIKIQLEGNSVDEISSFENYQKIEYLKKIATTLPKYNLDPRRKIRTSEYLTAIQQCDELLRINVGLYQVHFYKALFLMHMEDFIQATREVNISIQLAPGRFDPLLLKASILINASSSDEAKGVLDQLVTEFPDEPEGWFLLSKVYSKENNRTMTIESLLRSVLGKYIIPQVLTNLRAEIGMVQSGLNDFSDPDIYKLYFLYTSLWTKGNEEKNTWQSATELVGRYPGFYLSYFILGRYEMKNKNFKSAAQYFKECISCNPGFSEAHREIALCYFNMKICIQAELHASLYLQLSDAVTDYYKIEDARKKCKL
jgi:TolB-like protein